MPGTRRKDHATARLARSGADSHHDASGPVNSARRGRHRRSAVTLDRSANPGFRDVFAVAEFRALWGAQLLSVAGDQLARVALTVLVYDQTRSALLAAVAYAASIIPVFLGGILLSGVTDRRPRRQVMIVC